MTENALKNYTIKISESIYTAHWKLYRNNTILVVLDEENKYKGVITFKDIARTYAQPDLCLKDVCNYEGKFIQLEDEESEELYTKAKEIFDRYGFVQHIPVINLRGELCDIVSRKRVYWKHFYDTKQLPRMHYAASIYGAAFEAKELGYDSISVIEFGVAGGNGLVCCEFHAREVSRLLNIKIEVYGFDTGEGLLESNAGFKDMLHIWEYGSYRMDYEKLKERLSYAKLVIGDVNDTGRDFFTKYRPAPVGCMLIDVDRYSATVPILKMLDEDNSRFLPRVYMYFDDIVPEYEFSGETLAIKEFNQSHEMIKISPEGMAEYAVDDYRRKLKQCHRFDHTKYNEHVRFSWYRERTNDPYQLPLQDNMF